MTTFSATSHAPDAARMAIAPGSEICAFPERGTFGFRAALLALQRKTEAPDLLALDAGEIRAVVRQTRAMFHP